MTVRFHLDRLSPLSQECPLSLGLTLSKSLSCFSGFRKKGQVLQTNVTKNIKFHFLWSFAVALSNFFPILLFNFNNSGRDKMTICKICKLQLKIKMLLFSEQSPFSILKSIGILCSLHVVCSSIRGSLH